jgi:hypothetical protein
MIERTNDAGPRIEDLSHNQGELTPEDAELVSGGFNPKELSVDKSASLLESPGGAAGSALVSNEQVQTAKF